MPSHQIHFRPHSLANGAGDSISISPGDAGFEHLTFQVRRFGAKQRVSSATEGNELGIVVLGGICSVESPSGVWSRIGKRANVFEGVAYTLYLPIETQFTLTAETDCEVAFCYCAARKPYPARLITPEEVEIEIRGGGNATRQINHLLKPDFPADRILLVEVYTPSGNWSSYPPHKHDVHNPPGEVDLEEIY